eukprot:COSAG06_NODE_1518_length_9216_cov_3.400461_1_plen_69_part_10
MCEILQCGGGGEELLAARRRSVTLVKSSVALLGPGLLAPIQPLCLPLKPAAGTQTLAHPNLAFIHAIIS